MNITLFLSSRFITEEKGLNQRHTYFLVACAAQVLKSKCQKTSNSKGFTKLIYEMHHALSTGLT